MYETLATGLKSLDITSSEELTYDTKRNKGNLPYILVRLWKHRFLEDFKDEEVDEEVAYRMMVELEQPFNTLMLKDTH